MVKTYKDYVSLVASDYPDIDEKIIEKVIKMGLSNTQKLIANGFDVKLNHNMDFGKYQFVVVETKAKDQKMINTRAKVLKSKLEKLRSKWIK